MSLAIFRVMLLGLLRDRGALAMSFLVPAAFFLIFAAISASTTENTLGPRVALADEVNTALSQSLIQTLRDQSGLRMSGNEQATGDDVREAVRRGTADVGLIVRADPALMQNTGGDAPAPFVLVRDPARNVASTLLGAQLQNAYASALSTPPPSGSAAGTNFDADAPMLVVREDVVGRSAGLNHIAYHAGAVAVLFLLFSCVHGALSLLEENETGILERILAGPGSTRVLINGKFLYLVTQGFVQVGVIFLVAWLAHGVDLPGHWLGWLVVTFAASCAAAGIALGITSACTTRRQAQSVANVVVLIVSAIGGSMVPRFLMPPLLQDIGWLTPNTWALEAYTAIFWRDQPLSSVLLPAGVLLGSALVALVISQRLASRLESF